jgi:hypothetical protein
MTIKNFLFKLKEQGMTDAEIGQEIGASQSIIFRLRTGQHKSTSYERGEAIKNLVIKKCPVIRNTNEE